jgi:hypothetical protein
MCHRRASFILATPCDIAVVTSVADVTLPTIRR